jgi:prepilin-type N-terminal cleavage/methylation domain-containing protein
MRRGLTLIEMLAATVLLGLLAATVVPLQARWSDRLQRIDQRFAAATALERERAESKVPASDQVDGHPGWRIERSDIAASGGLVPPRRLTGYRWRRLLIRDADGTVLAETLLAVLERP